MTGGWIHLITGCMFSGKTDEMLRLIRRAEIAGRRVMLVRPAMDDRTEAGSVESRSGVTWQAETVADSSRLAGTAIGVGLKSSSRSEEGRGLRRAQKSRFSTLSALS